MNTQESEQRLRLTVLAESDWDGEIEVVVKHQDGEGQLNSPGKRVGEVLLVESADGRPRLLVSLGPQEELNAESYRKAGGATAKWLIGRRVQSAGFRQESLANSAVEDSMGAFCEGLLLGAYQFERHKSGQKGEIVTQVSILADGDLDRLEEIASRTTALVAGVNLARDLAHEPPNVINPLTLAERAQKLADQTGLKCTIMDQDELLKLGAGAILSVGQGSTTGSQMIVLEYAGQAGHEGEAPVVLVGKAITFDTGGYSLKNRTGIVGMKYDKSGGAAVLGIMQAVASFAIPIPVVGIVAAAENMISAEAYRPNDIIRSLSGKTIEIISTDAEGRLVLADALTYAHSHYQPRAIIDLATLTGGIWVALGGVRAGLMSNNDPLAETLLAAGERVHERLWRMPLDDDYFRLIKGDDSDIKNSAGKSEASPIVGAIFLKQFVPDEIPWAHLDIAGPATTEADLPYCPKGATGFGVRLVLEYMRGID